jgi:hypothetical protein
MRVFSAPAFALVLAGCGDEAHVPPSSGNNDGLWLWIGQKEDAPPCPAGSLTAWEGWTHEASPEVCGACTCGPAKCMLTPHMVAYAGMCPPAGLPTGIVSIADAGEGGDAQCVPFDPPRPGGTWRSVVFEPPTFAPCAPSPPPEPPPMTAMLARACKPSAEKKPPSFFVCIPPNADGTCSEGFAVRREIADQLSDERACTSCACGEPSGEHCIAWVSLCSTATCQDPDRTCFESTRMPLGPETLCDNAGSDNWPLAAMGAVFQQAGPGVCTPTPSLSTVTGTIRRIGPRVVCCDGNSAPSEG